MLDKRTVHGLKERIQEAREEIDRLQETINELEEEEKRLSDELARVRNYVIYYGSLVSDMKKHMQGRGNINIFDFL